MLGWWVSATFGRVILLLSGLGGFFVTQLVKTAFPIRPWLKMVLALVGSTGISAAVFYHHPSDLVIYGVAGAGLAVVVNRFARLLLTAGDWCIRRIIISRREV